MSVYTGQQRRQMDSAVDSSGHNEDEDEMGTMQKDRRQETEQVSMSVTCIT